MVTAMHVLQLWTSGIKKEIKIHNSFCVFKEIVMVGSHYLLITEGTMYLSCYEQWNIFHVLHNRLWKLNQVWKQRRDIDLCTLQGCIIWSLLMYIKCPVETYLQPRKLNLTGLNNQFRCIIICYLTLHIKDY